MLVRDQSCMNEEGNEAAQIALAAMAEQQSTEAALAEQQRAAAGRTAESTRAQKLCDAAAKAKQATMNSESPAKLAEAYQELAKQALASRKEREEKKAENAASAGVANPGEAAPPASPADEPPVNQALLAPQHQPVNQALLASQHQANAAIEYYKPAQPGAETEEEEMLDVAGL